MSRYKIDSNPSINDDISELADFIEIQCLSSEEGMYSLESARSFFCKESDEINFNGVDDDDDKIRNRLTAVFCELVRRERNSAGHYPFVIQETSLLKINVQCGELVRDVYKYLLYATRVNMNQYRRFGEGGKDASLLFEKLSRNICECYFGSGAKSMVLGTSENRSFKDKVKELLHRLNYRATYKDPIGSNGHQKDVGVDVVVWNPFYDKKDSMLIGFAQCKTGTSWNTMAPTLNPVDFFRNYSTYQPTSDPIKMFFVSEAISESEQWEERTRKTGILFDRVRIMSLLPTELDSEIIADIREWNSIIDDMRAKE